MSRCSSAAAGGANKSQFHLFATDLSTGLAWEFSGLVMGLNVSADIPPYLPSGAVSIADALAASAAFPPVLSPARFSFPGTDKFLERHLAQLRVMFPGRRAAIEEYAPTMRRLARHYDPVLLADGGVANNLGTILCGSLKNLGPCFIADAAITPQRSKVYPTWIGQLLRTTNILYDRKEDEVRANTIAVDQTQLIGSVLIKLRNRGDFENVNLDSAGVFKDLKDHLARTIQLAREGDPYLLEWATQAETTWQSPSYTAGDSRKLIDHYQQYACDAMIGTRLAALDDQKINELIDLGYISADIATADEIVMNTQNAEELSAERRFDIQSKLSRVLKASVPGLLRTPLVLPMQLGEIPTAACKKAVD